MRLSRLAPLAITVLSNPSLAQAPVSVAPAAEPTPPSEPAPPPEPAPPSVPSAPEAAPGTDDAAPPPGEVPAPPAEMPAPPEPPPASPDAPTPVGPAPVIASTDAPAPRSDEPAPFRRAREPLTLEGHLGFVARPWGSDGFDDESQVGALLGASLYLDLKKEIALGLEIDRASLGRGSSVDGLDSVSVDYAVTSAMLGFRAYPLRTHFVDVFVGLQLGLGLQSVSATGTENNGALVPASAYTCGATDSPAFQIGGGVGARLMLSERWGVSARVSGTGRRLTSEVVGECARGIGTATTVSGGIGLGYDFELDP